MQKLIKLKEKYDHVTLLMYRFNKKHTAESLLLNVHTFILIFLEYLRKCSLSCARDIRQYCTSDAIQCIVFSTLGKLKTVLLPLKEPIEKRLRSELIIYKIK